MTLSVHLARRCTRRVSTASCSTCSRSTSSCSAGASAVLERSIIIQTIQTPHVACHRRRKHFGHVVFRPTVYLYRIGRTANTTTRRTPLIRCAFLLGSLDCLLNVIPVNQNKSSRNYVITYLVGGGHHERTDNVRELGSGVVRMSLRDFRESTCLYWSVDRLERF